KPNDDAHGCRLVSRLANHNIACAARIHRQHLINIARQYRGFHIQNIEVVLRHLVVRVFAQRESTIEDGVANSFQLATGHHDSLCTITSITELPSGAPITDAVRGLQALNLGTRAPDLRNGAKLATERLSCWFSCWRVRFE